jgi:catechol 2,3-dioxygenase-like lactoylglutathione lyase family enzyme
MTKLISVRHIRMRLILCLILCLAGYTNYILVSPTSAFGADAKSPVATSLKVDHILLEVSNLTASIAFYRDFLGLRLKSQSKDFVMLESDNVGVFLWSARWDWEKPRTNGEREGLGMYPHFEVSDAAAIVDRARQAGYRIVQEPRKYDWGTEAFIADPDGYTWAFVSPRK